MVKPRRVFASLCGLIKISNERILIRMYGHCFKKSMEGEMHMMEKT
jgi:hypothetical protein